MQPRITTPDSARFSRCVPVARPRRDRAARRILVAVAAALALVGAGVGVTPAQAARNPYQRGPAPTEDSLSAPRGPFDVAEARIPSGVRGFGGGTLYYPTDTSQGTFGAVAISPGWLGTWGQHSWLGPRLASQGFVVIGVDTTTIFDTPESRGDQLLIALDWAVSRSVVAGRIDRDRLAVAGHSMGGGGALEAAVDRPALQAAIPLAPWHGTRNWSRVRVPTLVMGAERDIVAPVSSHAERFYATIPAASEKAYVELNDADHLFPLTANTQQARYMIAWLKRFVDDDTRYERFLCPGPGRGGPIEKYRITCPL